LQGLPGEHPQGLTGEGLGSVLDGGGVVVEGGAAALVDGPAEVRQRGQCSRWGDHVVRRHFDGGEPIGGEHLLTQVRIDNLPLSLEQSDVRRIRGVPLVGDEPDRRVDDGAEVVDDESAALDGAQSQRDGHRPGDVGRLIAVHERDDECRGGTPGLDREVSHHSSCITLTPLA
jgi:hypothetical protein